MAERVACVGRDGRSCRRLPESVAVCPDAPASPGAAALPLPDRQCQDAPSSAGRADDRDPFGQQACDRARDAGDRRPLRPASRDAQEPERLRLRGLLLRRAGHARSSVPGDLQPLAGAAGARRARLYPFPHFSPSPPPQKTLPTSNTLTHGEAFLPELFSRECRDRRALPGAPRCLLFARRAAARRRFTRGGAPAARSARGRSR